ncbi:unnamed protein product, partial [Allacma fusca]|jgi:hypothetical protein
VALQ